MLLCYQTIKMFFMMVVVADDFTGAAEIGGIALRYNLGVDILTNVDDNLMFDRDINIIVTDSRSMDLENAIKVNNSISRKLRDLGISNIFKKVDSAFRGYVYDELVEHLKIFKKNRSILIAGNPILRRIINDGIYYIGDKPINETCFSKDPEFPIKSSIVKEIIRKTSDINVYTGISPLDELPSIGIIVGDVINLSDLELWAEKITDDTLPAGSAGFFDYILKSKYKQIEINIKYNEEIKNFGENILLVFGSSYSKNKAFYHHIKNNKFYISDMPFELYNKINIEQNFKNWSENVIMAMNEYKKVAITVSHKENLKNKENIVHVRKYIAKLVANVIYNCRIDDLLIEGGSTAAAIFKEMNINKIYPVYEYDMGVIKMKVDNYENLKITTKPGSYKWPEFFEKDVEKQI